MGAVQSLKQCNAPIGLVVVGLVVDIQSAL